MPNWRDVIINKFRNQSSSFLFVYDLDFLLNEEMILNYLAEKGYLVLRYDDSITFRYIYEQKIREKEKERKLIVFANEDISLPYEFEKKALKIKIDIQIIFPKFSANVIRKINREDFDGLYRVHQSYNGKPTEQETLAYIVKHFYKIPYEIIDGEVGLYKILLSIHYQSKNIPEALVEFLYKNWNQIHAFKKLPLKDMIGSSKFFYRYLEEEWKKLVMDVSRYESGQVHDPLAIEYRSPLADGDVRRMMNDLFLEGTLEKVKGIEASNLPDWMMQGIEAKESVEDMEKKLDFLYSDILNKLSDAKRYQDWIKIIVHLAEYKHTSISMGKDHDELIKNVNQAFQSWMLKHYHSLTSLPPYPKPKLVHHIPHTINNDKANNDKVALLVLDGMSYFEWIFVRNHLKVKGFNFDEDGVFAWVPTLTSVSRQAIFSGNAPLTFGKSITTTATEEKWWKAFWEEHGVLKQYVTYQKGLGAETYDRSSIKGLSREATKVYGAVVDVIDQISHHAVLGEKSIFSQLQLWLESNYLENLLQELHQAGFTIYITSDHGNTNATGIGRISEGVLVDQRGERVRIYRDRTIYEDSAYELPAIKWPNIGLPDDYYVLLAQYGQAFVPNGQNIVTHGGISIEEVIVPFAKVDSVKGSGLE
ncbi:BREX-3 system phosphatase PglZ [Pueribacillus theae]|uniref:BREX-3 system phosphatase PglZ n=1 Tax=Pueribacillus theae TaxID=2171751 RepID=A0A2U1JRR8_9BACI|nr:BREX-3 system phosphatase PglZ [Pueribacillus theae]PWA07896.1 BREX-3 system phosphatase PglZ [Pueribacillus theae]